MSKTLGHNPPSYCSAIKERGQKLFCQDVFSVCGCHDDPMSSHTAFSLGSCGSSRLFVLVKRTVQETLLQVGDPDIHFRHAASLRPVKQKNYSTTYVCIHTLLLHWAPFLYIRTCALVSLVDLALRFVAHCSHSRQSRRFNLVEQQSWRCFRGWFALSMSDSKNSPPKFTCHIPGMLASVRGILPVCHERIFRMSATGVGFR